jgi:muconolactone delta-isomerase
MDFLVDFTITIPPDAPASEVKRRTAAEEARVAELAAQGHALRVWKPLPEDGRVRAVGLYRAADNAQLDAILASLPLRGWMQISVRSLAEHPNDPARSTPATPAPGALPSPKLRHVFRLDADLDAPLDLGDTPAGHRRVVAMTGGRAEGADFHAELLAGASADWQIVRATGSAVADVRYTLRTDGGALVYVQAHGVRHGSPEVLARLAAGELVDASEYTFRTSVTFETSDAELAWLNDGVFVAVGARQVSGVSYDVYLVE